MRFCSETPVRSHKFKDISHAPRFEFFSLDALNNEWTKTFRKKKRSTGSIRNRSIGRSTGVDFEIYRSCRENPDAIIIKLFAIEYSAVIILLCKVITITHKVFYKGYILLSINWQLQVNIEFFF